VTDSQIQVQDPYYLATLMENRFFKGIAIGALLGGCIVALGTMLFRRK